MLLITASPAALIWGMWVCLALQDLTMMPLSRLDCPLSLKTPNMGNPG